MSKIIGSDFDFDFTNEGSSDWGINWEEQWDFLDEKIEGGKIWGNWLLNLAGDLEAKMSIKPYFNLGLDLAEFAIDYSIGVEAEMPRLVQDGSRFSIDTSRWGVQESQIAGSSIDLANAGIDAGLEFDFSLTANNFKLDPYGFDEIDLDSLELGLGFPDRDVKLLSGKLGSAVDEINNAIDTGPFFGFSVNAPEAQKLESGVGSALYEYTKPSAEVSTEVLSFDLDLDRMAQSLFFPGQDFLEYSFESPGGDISLDATLLDIEANLDFNLYQKVDFTFDHVEVEMTDGNGNTQIGRLGDSFNFYAPNDDTGSLDVSASYKIINPAATVSYGLQVVPYISADVGEMDVKFDLGGFANGSYKVGPLASLKWPDEAIFDPIILKQSSFDFDEISRSENYSVEYTTDDLSTQDEYLQAVDFSGSRLELANSGDERSQTVDIIQDSKPFLGFGANDTLEGDQRNNHIISRYGNDVINAKGGDDYIEAGIAGDEIDGGEGTDYLTIENHSNWSLDYYVRTAASSDVVNVDERSSYDKIHELFDQAPYSVQLLRSNGTRFTNIEKFEVEGSSYDDLMIYQQGVNDYHAKGGTDTFYADWSNETAAVDWTNTRSNDEQNPLNDDSVSISGVERLLLSTGSGDDVIDNSQINGANDYIATGEGNDRIFVGSGYDTVEAGAGNDYIATNITGDEIDGGEGTDYLYIENQANRSLDYHVRTDASSDVVNVDERSSYDKINDLFDQAPYSVQLVRSDGTRFTNIEKFEVEGSDYDDLMIYQQGVNRYEAKGGTDTFYADWSNETAAVDWTNTRSNDEQNPLNDDSVSISGVERLLLSTGSGDDVIDNSQINGANDYIATGEGNDRIFVGSGYDTVEAGAGNDYIATNITGDEIDGGEGTDYLYIENQANRSLDYHVRTDASSDVVNVDERSSYDKINDLFDQAPYSVQLVRSDGTRFTNIEKFEVEGSDYDDLMIYQQGVNRYEAKGGTDTFYADWSNETAAVDWTNTRSNDEQNPLNDDSVSISGVERLLLSTGSGDDVIDNSQINGTNDYIATGEGNDRIFVGSGYDTVEAGAGNDYIATNIVGDEIDGGEGTDYLYIENHANWSLDYHVRTDASSDVVNVDERSSYDKIHDLFDQAPYSVQLVRSDGTRFTNIEKFEVEGSDYDDLMIYQQGVNRYEAKGGTDTFYADWSGETQPIQWFNHQVGSNEINSALDLTQSDSLVINLVDHGFVADANLNAISASIKDLDSSLHGTITQINNHQVRFTPDDGFTGVTHFGFSLSDGSRERDFTASVAVNDASTDYTQDSARPLTAQPDVDITGVERLLLTLGSESDIIDNSRYGTNNFIDAGAGDDQIYLGRGTDEIIAGAGSDFLSAGAGNDRYYINGTNWNGDNVISEDINYNNLNTIYLLALASIEDVKLTQIDNDLLFTNQIGTGTVTLKDYFTDNRRNDWKIVINGQTYSERDIDQHIELENSQPVIQYVEQQGSAALKTVDGVYTIETPDRDVILRRGDRSEYSENDRFTFTAVEPKAEGRGFMAIMTFDNGRVSIREFNANGILQDFTAPQRVADVVDQEAALGIDINGDGEIADITYVEQQGSVDLKTVNGVYTIETPDRDVILRRGDRSEYSENDRFTFTAVEPKAEGRGFMAIMTFDNGRVSIREFNANGILQDFTAPQRVADVVDQEAALGIDINGDGEIADITYVEQQGSVDLKTVNGVYTIETPDRDVILRRGDRSEYSENDRFTFTAVEPKAEGRGFMAIMTFDNGRVSIREFNANGILQDFTAPQRVADVVDQEAALGIDINGDGEIADITYVEQQGSIDLKTVNGVYTIETPDRDVILRRGDRSEYSENDRFTFTAVEPKAEGRGFMAIMTFDNGRVSIREFNANGILQDFTAPQRVADVVDQEAALGIDINGDGEIADITYVEQQGSVDLKTVNGVYTIETPDRDVILRRGDRSEYSENDRFTFTAVEPKAEGRGFMAIMTFDNGRVSIREFNANGILQDFTAPQRVADVVDQEAALGIDINGDGEIADITYVEQQGSVDLKTVNGVYTIETPDRDVILRRGDRSEYSENDRFTFTAVEPKAEGRGFMAIMTFDNGRVSIREFNANGILQDFTAPQRVADVVDQEAALGIDINGDGEIADITYVEQQGSVDLKTVNGVYTIETPDRDVILRRGDRSEYSENDRFTFTAVEPKSEGRGFMAIMTFDNGRVSIREFNANGILQDFTAPQRVADVLDQEAELGIDINGDGEIADITYVEQQGSIDLKTVNGVYTIETPDRDVILRRGDRSEYSENDRFTFTAVEPSTEDNGFVAIMTFDNGRVSIREFNANGILQDFTAPQRVADVLDQEAALGIDINGDGEISIVDDFSPDGRATNGVIEDNQTLTGSLEVVGDRDWFAIDLSAGDEIIVNLTGDFDTVLSVQDSTGNELAFDDDGGEGLNSSLSFEVAENDTYYLIAAAYADNYMGDYQLETLNLSGFFDDLDSIFNGVAPAADDTIA